MNTERLLNVARALRESPTPEKFEMGNVTHACGTPACAIGHYIARQDLQQEFKPLPVDSIYMGSLGTAKIVIGEDVFDWENVRVREHFDITAREFEELFGPSGCGMAKTPIEAAEYIERFVADRPL
jgi:hypothetical protein